jgi:hypothetical protein
METIPGAIIIYSCHKHQFTRLREFSLPKNCYLGWKVFYVIGNPLMEQEYTFNGNFLTIKCEDSYIHVMKKVLLAIKILNGLYIIEQGILRCGDDIHFNEAKLEQFLSVTPKDDYMGSIHRPGSKLEKIGDTWMPNYYRLHPEDLQNPLHGLTKYTLQEIMQFNERPSLGYTHGVIVYLSVRSCNILIEQMEKISWDIFTKDEYGYPYIIEDVGVGYTLHINGIFPTNYELFSYNYNVAVSHPTIFGYHTNKYK